MPLLSSEAEPRTSRNDLDLATMLPDPAAAGVVVGVVVSVAAAGAAVQGPNQAASHQPQSPAGAGHAATVGNGGQPGTIPEANSSGVHSIGDVATHPPYQLRAALPQHVQAIRGAACFALCALSNAIALNQEITAATILEINLMETCGGEIVEDSTDEEEYPNGRDGRRKKRFSTHWYTHVCCNFTAKEFQAHFRLHKVTFQRLLEHVGNCHAYQEVIAHRRVEPVVDLPKLLLMTLWHLSGGTTNRRTAQQFGVATETCRTAIQQGIQLLVSLVQTVITWPTSNEMRQSENVIWDRHHMHGAFGAIDGTHFPFKASMDQKKQAADRKGVVSINATLVVDAFMRIREVHVGYFGSCHDARVFAQMWFVRKMLEHGRNKHESPLRPIPQGSYLLGDAAYPLCSYVITPISEEGGRWIDILFNKAHSGARMVAERSLGKMKRQWKCLTVPRWTHEGSCLRFLACSVLHNFTVDDSELYAWWGDMDVDELAHNNDDWTLADAMHSDDVPISFATQQCLLGGSRVRYLARERLRQVAIENHWDQVPGHVWPATV